MLHVFLVDDEYFVRTSLKENIPWNENGFELIGEANNGKTAYEQILSLKPDLAIVDINMPGYNGIELITLLSESHTSCKFIILTGYAEFQYARQAIRLGVYDYILKPIDYALFVQSLNAIKSKILVSTSITQKVEDLEQENHHLLLNQYYNDLINCNLTTYSTSYYNSSLLPSDFSLSYNTFTIALIDSASLMDLPLVHQLIKDNFTTSHHVIGQDNKKRVFIIFDSLASDCSVLLQNIYNCLTSFSLSVRIGIGSQYSNFEQIYLSYNEAEIALQNYSILKENIIFFDHLESNHLLAGLDSKTKHLLKTYILNKDLAKIDSLIHSSYEIFRQEKRTFNSIMLCSVEFIYLLTEVLSGQSSQPISVLKVNDNILDKFSEMHDIQKICDWVISIYKESISALLTETSAYSDVTQRIVTYIQEHYSDAALSIPAIAEKLYLNYSYLCFCFKRDKDITINDYLNQMRLEKSLELLQSGIDNISYIAEKVGFSDSGYFSKRFKKAIGLSPSEYIRTLQH